MQAVELFDLSIHNVTMPEAVEAVRELASQGKNAFVVTPNVDHIVKLHSDPDFQAVYRQASLVIADGMPLVWLSRLVKTPLKGRVTGSDLFLEVCNDAQTTGARVFLLGSASQEIIERARAELLHRYPQLNIVGALSPSFGFEKKDEENQRIVQAVREARTDILFVGVGAPKQEKWIYRFRDQLKVPVSLGVGASFDFVAGSVKRAPVWMQKCGLEWFYRFLKEPKRLFRRYFVEPTVFFRLAFGEWKKSRARTKT